MTRKPHSASLVLLLICIFAFWWGISLLSQSSIPVSNTVQTTFSGSNGSATPLVVHESVAGSAYTYSGTYMPRSVCDSFGSGIRYNSEDGGHVSILLIAKPSTIDCAQAEDTAAGEPFTVAIKLAVGSNPQFDGVFLNGTKLPSQLIKSN
jgi:hypothetical protein